jgi:hypothetical protein
MSAFPQNDRITRFYEAFRALDGEAMQAAYAPNAEFEDEVFTLRGRDEIGAMWRMLCSAVKDKGRADWKFDFSGIDCDDEVGIAHWEPTYRFSATGRIVHNMELGDLHVRRGNQVRVFLGEKGHDVACIPKPWLAALRASAPRRWHRADFPGKTDFAERAVQQLLRQRPAIPRKLDSTASSTGRSAAVSCTRMPPTTFTKTS